MEEKDLINNKQMDNKLIKKQLWRKGTYFHDKKVVYVKWSFIFKTDRKSSHQMLIVIVFECKIRTKQSKMVEKREDRVREQT